MGFKMWRAIVVKEYAVVEYSVLERRLLYLLDDFGFGTSDYVAVWIPRGQGRS